MRDREKVLREREFSDKMSKLYFVCVMYERERERESRREVDSQWFYFD